MSIINFRMASLQDATALNTALRALSHSIGDTHRASDDQIARALSGPCRAVLAEAGQELAGAAMFSPLFSTARGMAGAYVSDLWVSPDWRGAGLGQRLLATVRDTAARDWGAGFLRLGVYTDNTGARRLYERLGFVRSESEHYLTLSGPALAALKGKP